MREQNPYTAEWRVVSNGVTIGTYVKSEALDIAGLFEHTEVYDPEGELFATFE